MVPPLVSFRMLRQTVVDVRQATYHINKILALAEQYLEDDDMLVDLSEFANEVICYVDAYPDKFDRVQDVTETVMAVKVAHLIVNHIKQHCLLA